MSNEISESANSIKISLNLKLTGTATVDLNTGQLDWGTTRLHGSIFPIDKLSGEQVVGEKVPLANRKHHDFAFRLGTHFATISNVVRPKSQRSNEWIYQWQNPILAMLRQVWTTYFIHNEYPYGYDDNTKLFKPYKYDNCALGAVRRLIETTYSQLDNNGMTISSPKSLQKTAVANAAEYDYIQLAYDENLRIGKILELPKKQ